MTERQGPLVGVGVLVLGGIGPTPFAANLLADMGADLTFLERPGLRYDVELPPAPGARRVEINLRSEAGVAQALREVAKADIVIEGFRPGVAERLGLGPADCHARRPDLVYGRMTGWGQEGPWSDYAGHDINYISITGALHALGPRDGPPTIPLCLVGDLGGGAMFLVAQVLAALHEAQRTGRGRVVDAAIVDGACTLMGPIYQMLRAGVWSDEREANLLDGGLPWYAVYRTRDDRWMAVGALEEPFYQEFTRLLGLAPREADRSDRSRWPALRERIAARFLAEDRSHWEGVFAATDACVTPVLTMTEAPKHPHIVARGLVADPASAATGSRA